MITDRIELDIEKKMALSLDAFLTEIKILNKNRVLGRAYQKWNSVQQNPKCNTLANQNWDRWRVKIEVVFLENCRLLMKNINHKWCFFQSLQMNMSIIFLYDEEWKC